MTRLLVALLLVAGCDLPLEEGQRIPTYALFDPEQGEIPMPSDLLRNEDDGRLALPTDDETLSPTERSFREWLDTRDGWATTMPATVRFSDAIDPQTVDQDNVQVWDFGGAEPRRFGDATFEMGEDDRLLSIVPPRSGWERGHTYVIVVRGRDGGVRDAHGYGIEAAPTFWFLRQVERLDTIQHNRAFPGATRADRLDKAARLEELRVELAPFFSFFEDEIPRKEVAALWSFTTTAEPELAMDRASQRIPLPFDLLLDRETGKVALEDAPWDTDLERDAKQQANELDGFAVSANLLFEATEAVDPTTLPGRVHVFEVEERRELPVTLHVMGDSGEAACSVTPTPLDCVHVVVEIADGELPLSPHTTYAIVVDRGIRSARGPEIEAMPIGWFMRSDDPIAIDGVSQIGSVLDDLATRLEATRIEIDALLDEHGREGVLTAWPFTTLDAVPGVREASRKTIDLDLDVEPTIRERLSPWDALEALFPGLEAAGVHALYLTRTEGVDEFIVGTLPSPYFLDRVTRRWRDDYEIEPVRFYLSIPEDADPNAPLPVVIFGHAVVTDARFMMTIAGELAQRGFATLTIDFPFHGERIACIDASLVGIPNYFPDILRDLTGLEDDILRFPPCASGSDATCSAEGQCLTADGQPDDFTAFPLVSVQVASGAAFLDVSDLPYINDHFRQALVDLSTALHAVRTADWSAAVGYRLDPERIEYAGQSLGAIIGAVWVAATPEIDRAVLNVPGADMVDLFRESTFFGPQIDEYFDSIDVARPSYEEERLLDVARWLIDSVDPHSVAHLFAQDDRPVLLQMDDGDIVIPNRTTEVLQRVSGRPMRTYPSFMHGDLVIPLVGDAMLHDMGAYLSGEI